MIVRNEDVTVSFDDLLTSLKRVSLSLKRIENRDLPHTRALLRAQERAISTEIDRLLKQDQTIGARFDERLEA